MDRIRVAGRARKWAVLGSGANIAQYGLQHYIRTGEVDQDAVGYLKRGMILFSLLQEGVEVTLKGRITAASQIGSVNALEPIQPKGKPAVLENFEIEYTAKTIDAILEGKRPETEGVNKALENLFKVSEAYLDAAFDRIRNRSRYA